MRETRQGFADCASCEGPCYGARLQKTTRGIGSAPRLRSMARWGQYWGLRAILLRGCNKQSVWSTSNEVEAAWVQLLSASYAVLAIHAAERKRRQVQFGSTATHY